MWEKFAEEIWKPEWEVADGPDLKPGRAEDVSVLLRIDESRRKNREEERDGSTQANGLAFGSYPREETSDPDDEIPLAFLHRSRKSLKDLRQKHAFTSSRSDRQMTAQAFRDSESGVVISQELSCRQTWSDIPPGMEKPTDLTSFHALGDWDGLLSDDIMLRAIREQGGSPKMLSSHGLRQERRKVKRSGGTKRQGEDMITSSSDKQHGVTQVEHRIDMRAGSSATFHGNTRNVTTTTTTTTKTMNSSSYRMPVETSVNATTSTAVYRSYLNTQSAELTSHGFDASTTTSFPSSGNRSNLFSFIGGVAGLDDDSVSDWAMDDMSTGGGSIDMDDLHHPHKKVHKPFTSESTGKVNKPTKKPGRRSGSRTIASNSMSLFPTNSCQTMNHSTSKFSTVDESGIHKKESDSTTMESKNKKEEQSSPLLPKYTHALGKERQRRASLSERRTAVAMGRTASSKLDPVTGMQHPPSSAPMQKNSATNMIDRIDKQGRCPLHVAVMADRPDVVNVLLEYGCDAMMVLPNDLQTVASGQHALDAFPSSSVPPVPMNEIIKKSSKSRTDGFEPDADKMAEFNQQQQIRIERPEFVDRLSLKLCNALHLAAYFGHLTVLDILLSNTNIDPAAKNVHGCTALHLAANNGHAKIVARLLEHPGCCIDATDCHKLSALHHAAAKGRSNVINILWPKGCKIDATDDIMGWTALHYAAQAGHVEAVGNLIIAGCPVSKYDKNGLTPGHLAAYEGYADVLQKLLHAGFYHDLPGGVAAQRGRSGSTALHLAASRGHVDVINQLLAEGANIHKDDHRGLNPLQCAAEGGHLEAFNILLEAGCNPKKADTLGTTLHSAATGGNWDIVSKLLDLNCDPSVRTSFGKTLLHNAAQVGALKVTENLLRLGCDIHVPDKDDNMPWHAAAEGGNLDVLEMFLGRGCDIEAKNRFGMTALHCAASSGSLPIVKALVGKGAVLKAIDKKSQTALHIAAERGHEDVLITLIERVNAEVVNAKDNTDMTILHHVCRGRALNALSLLVKRGADVNAANRFGETPLHLATIHQLESNVEALLENRCNVTLKDAKGCTALFYAAQKSKASIFNLLFAAKGYNVGDKDNKGHGLLHYAVEGGDPEIVEKLLSKGAAQYDHGSAEVMNALHLACELGHVSVASCLIATGYNVREKGPDGLEPIHFASGARRRESPCFSSISGWNRNDSDDNEDVFIRPWTPGESEQHDKIVSILIDEKADVHVVDKCGCNALMYAAGVGDLDLVMKYLQMNVDPTRLDTMDCSAMHWAAKSGNDAIIDQLIRVGVPVASSNKEGRLPLHEASARGKLAAVCAFVDAMTEENLDIHKRDAKDKTPVQLAAQWGYVDIVTKLLEGAKEKEVKGMTGLHLAIQMKLDDIVKALLMSRSCDVNARDNDECTPLHYAAESGLSTTPCHPIFMIGGWHSGQAEIVELLLRSKADLSSTNADGVMPIHRASAEGHLDVVDRMIEHGALRNHLAPSGLTPLHFAASAGHLAVMKRLIARDVQVNHLSSGSGACTALYSAASSGNLDAVNLLLEHKAEVDTVCANECTALHVAASNGHAAIVRRLIDAGAEVDFQAANSIAAIHNAVNNGHYEATEALIAADCDVDLQNSSGNTPLHLAACKGSVELARLILNANCDIHIKNLKGHQAIHSAASNGSFDVVLLLVQHGASWRQKGDLDVAKMLCRKTNLMASYVDGRLRMAERAKHRKAKTMEASESVPTEEELRQKQAHADAVMAELLAEEEKEKQQGDQKQKNRRNKDRKKKSHSVTEQKKQAAKSKTATSEQKPNCTGQSLSTEDALQIEEPVRCEIDERKSEKDEQILTSLPRVLVRGSSLRREEDTSSSALFTEVRTKATETRQRKRETHNKQKKNRQPAPRTEPASHAAKNEQVRTVRKSPVPTTMTEKKKAEDSMSTHLPKPSCSSVTVIRRRQQTQPSLTASHSNEVRKLQNLTATVRDGSSREALVQSTRSGSRRTAATGLARSVSVPEARLTEKKPTRHTSNRSLTMAAVVAGATTKTSHATATDTESISKEEPVIPKRTESSHVWAGAIKSTMEKKSPEVKNDTFKSGQLSRKKPTKATKETDIKVVNVSSNKRAFLPFTDGQTVVDKPMSIHHSFTAEVNNAGERTNETSMDDKDLTDEREEKAAAKESVLKWVTKDLSPTASSQQTDLKGTRATPLAQKMKKLNVETKKEESLTPSSAKGTEAEEKVSTKTTPTNPWSMAPPHRPLPSIEALSQPLEAVPKIESPWKSVTKDHAWTQVVDPNGYPPLGQARNNVALEGVHSLPVPTPTGFPFPGGSADWGTSSYDLYSSPPPPPPKESMVSSHSWEPTNSDVALTMTDGDMPSQTLMGDPFEDGNVSFGDPPALFYTQMDPDSLLPPELKEEITNGGATSNHFRPKMSLSSGRGSPTPNQSPSAKALPYPSPTQGSPAWTKNAQGPFLPGRMNVPPPPPAPPVLSQSSAVISRIPDDPWEIDEIDVSHMKMPEVAQPPPPEVHPFEERLPPYLCPLSRRPITDPVIAADGYTYDRASIQGNHAYYNPYVSYSNGYML